MTAGSPMLRIETVAEAAEVRRVRAAVREFCDGHGVSPAVTDDVLLAVTEACANVVAHAYEEGAPPGPLEVDVRLEAARLLVAVSDQGRGFMRSSSREGTGGWGLGLMRGLATHVDVVTREDDGSEVTFVFELPSPPQR
jgi:serine/threonine-protein kinase RsbW